MLTNQIEIQDRMTVADVAEFFGVANSTVRYWHKTGRLQLHKGNNGVLYATGQEVIRFAEGFAAGRRRR